MGFIKIDELIEEFATWGLETTTMYDSDGEAWILKVTDGMSEVTIHRAFEIEGELYANTSQLCIETADSFSNHPAQKNNTNFCRVYITVQARMNWVIFHRSKLWVNDFTQKLVA